MLKAYAGCEPGINFYIIGNELFYIKSYIRSGRKRYARQTGVKRQNIL